MNEPNHNTINVLLVDDDTALLRSLSRSLSDVGFTVTTAICADQALAIMEEAQIDVVVCDQKMPGPSGLELLSQLKEMYPQLIMMMLSGVVCGVNEAEDSVQALGVAELFCKPCDASLIAGRIRHAMNCREPSKSKS